MQKLGPGAYAYSTDTTVDVFSGLSAEAKSLSFNQRYLYDEQGRLLGEYSPEGKLIQETIWLDDLPVATIRPKGASVQLPLGTAGKGAGTANNIGENKLSDPVNVDIFYVHPDHLGTPRVVTRSVAVGGVTSGPNTKHKAVWRWDSDPFGSSLDASKPVENPQQVNGTPSQVTAASFRVNNRFPGQQFDTESGKQYNYFRDYDPSVGRYVESDPIGLRGGVNTFGYVGQLPVGRTDRRGLEFTYFPPAPGWNTIVCDGNGGVRAQVAPGQELCLTPCILAHEQCHIKDILAYGGSPCKGKGAGEVVSWPGIGRSEMNCGAVEIDCLIQQLAKTKSCDRCTPIIEQRLLDIWNYRGGANG